jgi:hypothetical protein
VSYYLYTKNTGIFFTGNTKASDAPCALEQGQGWLEGWATISHKTGFLQSTFFINPGYTAFYSGTVRGSALEIIDPNRNTQYHLLSYNY